MSNITPLGWCVGSEGQTNAHDQDLSSGPTISSGCSATSRRMARGQLRRYNHLYTVRLILSVSVGADPAIPPSCYPLSRLSISTIPLPSVEAEKEFL